mmetsp:Transcript_54605/g.132622  ORF Transcript_54605/g.132622 Transcript_54605/m.132622 type:complete len:188 (-) Transcript_54605:1221-1784(-)
MDRHHLRVTDAAYLPSVNESGSNTKARQYGCTIPPGLFPPAAAASSQRTRQTGDSSQSHTAMTSTVGTFPLAYDTRTVRWAEQEEILSALDMSASVFSEDDLSGYENDGKCVSYLDIILGFKADLEDEPKELSINDYDVFLTMLRDSYQDMTSRQKTTIDHVIAVLQRRIDELRSAHGQQQLRKGND